MNTPQRRLHNYTYAQYVKLETWSSTKHEFLDGEIYAMSGGSDEHAALAAQVIAVLSNALRERPCRVYTSDLRVRVEEPKLTTYPDAAVICGPSSRTLARRRVVDDRCDQRRKREALVSRRRASG